VSTPIEFCQARIKEAEELMRLASHDGNYEAFRKAEQDLENYKQMMKRYEKN
jgi:hypothetical protein